MPVQVTYQAEETEEGEEFLWASASLLAMWVLLALLHICNPLQFYWNLGARNLKQFSISIMMQLHSKLFVLDIACFLFSYLSRWSNTALIMLKSGEANSVASWYCMAGLFYVHNSFNFTSIASTTGWNAAPNHDRASTQFLQTSLNSLYTMLRDVKWPIIITIIILWESPCWCRNSV